MGSVKDLVIDPAEFGGKLYVPPGPHKFGQGVWTVSGRFSVGDLKDLIPPVEIEGKGEALAMMTSAYFEHLADLGISSTYMGMLSPEGEIVSARQLVDRGVTSNFVVMRLANIPASSKPDDVKVYHKAIADGDISIYVADAESIFRAGLPLGSSSFKKMFKFAGRGDIYEQVATYDETVEQLLGIREDVKSNGWGAYPGFQEYLVTLGLTDVPLPGQLLPRPVLDFTTKFDIGGDKEITDEETRLRMGLSGTSYAKWKELVAYVTQDQIDYCRSRGVTNIDGKVEGVVVLGEPSLTDFVCTPDENRLMISVERDGITYLIPSNKEIQRAMFRAAGVYDAIDKAKLTSEDKNGTTDNWRTYLFEHTTRDTLMDVTTESCVLMSDANKEVANRLLCDTVFDVRSVEQWVGPFLPYASRMQEDR